MWGLKTGVMYPRPRGRAYRGQKQGQVRFASNQQEARVCTFSDKPIERRQEKIDAFASYHLAAKKECDGRSWLLRDWPWRGNKC
jgi:hypothetical protein